MGRRRKLFVMPRWQKASQSGFSLLETLFAAVLLAVVAVSILPLFTRALQSNRAGGWSSVMSNFAGADIETANQMVIDHEDFDLPAGGVLETGAQYWNSGAVDTGEANKLIGDEQWEDDPSGPGLVLWVRNSKVRKYSFADISVGTISSDGSPTLLSLGHPELFDRPLDNDDGADGYKAHLTEIRVTVQPCRGCDGSESEQFLALGQRTTVSHFRAY